MTVYPHEAVVFPWLGALGQDRHRRKRPEPERRH